MGSRMCVPVNMQMPWSATYWNSRTKACVNWVSTPLCATKPPKMWLPSFSKEPTLMYNGSMFGRSWAIMVVKSGSLTHILLRKTRRKFTSRAGQPCTQRIWRWSSQSQRSLARPGFCGSRLCTSLARAASLIHSARQISSLFQKCAKSPMMCLEKHRRNFKTCFTNDPLMWGLSSGIMSDILCFSEKALNLLKQWRRFCWVVLEVQDMKSTNQGSPIFPWWFTVLRVSPSSDHQIIFCDSDGLMSLTNAPSTSFLQKAWTSNLKLGRLRSIWPWTILM